MLTIIPLPGVSFGDKESVIAALDKGTSFQTFTANSPEQPVAPRSKIVTKSDLAGQTIRYWGIYAHLDFVIQL